MDQQKPIIEELTLRAEPGGRLRSVEMREAVNGILYLLRMVCS
ncbi:MAG: hypothetical protein AAGH99_14930 [Planctomycetota bacterium]